MAEPRPQDVEIVRPAVESADVKPGRPFVVMVGEEPRTSAPSLTLSKALARFGIDVRFVKPDRIRRPEWIRLLRSATAILFVSYNEIDAYVLSQLATAVAMDVPIIRWWVGTDVLNAITHRNLTRTALRLDELVSANIAVGPHLVDELATIGIRAEFVPSVLDPSLVPSQMNSWTNELRPVLLYMPGRRREFYGVSVIEPVIDANPDVTFIVVADETHSLATYGNVESLGWVTDMTSIYARAGCVLRITQHDGLPRMLMEALLRGMYAIYSWPLAGCWQAHTSADIADALARYRTMTEPNIEGRTAMLDLLRAKPDLKMSGVIASASVPLPRRVHAMTMAVRSKVFPNQFR